MDTFTWVSHSKLFKLCLSLATKECSVRFHLSHGAAVSGKYHLCFPLNSPVAISSWYCAGTASPCRHPFTLQLDGVNEASAVDSGLISWLCMKNLTSPDGRDPQVCSRSLCFCVTAP